MTKRKDIIARINAVAKSRGEVVRKQEGGKHTKFWIGDNLVVVPRHREVKESLGRALLRDLDKLEAEK